MYAVAISYHSSKKRLVRNVARALSDDLGGTQHVFFDEFHGHCFRGPHAKSDLTRIYTNQAKWVVPFFSSNYDSGGWTGIEWQEIQKLIDTGSVLAVSLDGSRPPGWPSGAIPLSGTKKTGKAIAKEILEHITFQRHRSPAASSLETSLPANPSGSVAAESAATVESGFIVVGDLWNFSSLPPARVEPVIDHMWSVAREVGLLGDLHCGLLDGLVIVLRRGWYGDVIEQCNLWLKRMHEELAGRGFRCRPRLAVHRGDFYHIDSKNLLVGAGPNECSRLCSMAGPGQMVLSEDFVRGWRTDLGGEAIGDPQEFAPRLDEPPIGIQIKPGVQSMFRYYRHNLGASVVTPALIRADHAEKVLMKVVQEIEDEFVDLVTESCSGLTAGRIGATVSILVCDRIRLDAPRLVTTNFRYSRRSHRNGSVPARPRDQLCFEIDTSKKRGQGPAGLAFVTKKPYVTPALPPYRETRTGESRYAQILTSPPWNMPANVLEHLTPKPRRLLAIPCWLHGNLPHAEAVIEIDTLHPLDGVSDEFLHQCAIGFGRWFGVLIAALLWNRS
jgi:hypothetical protein